MLADAPLVPPSLLELPLPELVPVELAVPELPASPLPAALVELPASPLPAAPVELALDELAEPLCPPELEGPVDPPDRELPAVVAPLPVPEALPDVVVAVLPLEHAQDVKSEDGEGDVSANHSQEDARDAMASRAPVCRAARQGSVSFRDGTRSRPNATIPPSGGTNSSRA